MVFFWANTFAFLIYFIICFLLGVSLDYFFNYSGVFKNTFFKYLSMFVLGFGFFSILIYLIGMLYVPLTIWLFLLISLLVPLYSVFTDKKILKNLALKKFKVSIKTIAIILILAIFFVLIVRATFGYSWLEDDDPWNYALGAKYVATHFSYHTPNHLVGYNTYLYPNSPSTLAVNAGLLNQISPDLYFILKFFIDVCLLMAIAAFALFSYVMSRKNELFALIATAIMIMVPSFAGHFVFNYTVSVCLLLVSLFALSLTLKDNISVLLPGMILASVLTAHPVTGIEAAVILGIFFAFYLWKSIVDSGFKIRQVFSALRKKTYAKVFFVGLLALLFSLSVYGNMLIDGNILAMYNKPSIHSVITLNYDFKSYDLEKNTLHDFYKAESVGHMDQQRGVGKFLFVITLLGLLIMLLVKKWYVKENLLYALNFLFFFIFLWLFTGGHFHFSVQNYRWWSVFAIFVALQAASTIMIVVGLLRNNKAVLYVLFAIIFLGIIFTSAVPRYAMQGSQWPPGGGFVSGPQLSGYVNLRQIGANNLIFSMCSRGGKVVGNNQYNPIWEKPVEDYYSKFMMNDSVNKTTQGVVQKTDSLISAVGYKYMVIDVGCVKLLGLNETNSIMSYYSQKYKPVQQYSNNNFVLFDLRQNQAQTGI